MRWLRVLGGAAILAAVAWRVGPEPLADAARSAGPGAVSAALAITAVTTVCCACRWRALGADVPVGAAVAAYYRSQLLNATVPGGVAGDLHRAVRHGTLPVVAERGSGQLVQASAAGALLLAGPAPWASALLALAVLAAVSRWPVVVATSLVASAGHVVVFLVAARAVGTDASLATLLPLALVVMVGAAIPLNVAGWGPREGVAAGAFAAAGLGAAQGAAVSVLYGVLALVATLPGLVPLVRGVARA
ncbi:lysylphosphatidylglycerol synthase domain-containing protein [Nocardioides sp. YIM 152315]|uniref:lysylphosphatidylglycerol synthase domain-containing protein n=1 Tax=Nocardioides sp. YIM 152315 TaxID=3031760 RepID=UPI0023DBA3DE|nr:lysylphosphatidylglycerol synthase domain-containing protein [Nocardioides sp. YIM 152315]MDF1605230.1 lysylphosphatidylglycerol synthase domain-containing protein [Nocardioides sp. YIM 152315]